MYTVSLLLHPELVSLARQLTFSHRAGSFNIPRIVSTSSQGESSARTRGYVHFS
jgi:hypothetical protein